MIEAEDPADVLSDDVIVTRLRQADIVVARRTVAKYRDNLKIPSSVDRRRQKMAVRGGLSGAAMEPAERLKRPLLAAASER